MLPKAVGTVGTLCQQMRRSRAKPHALTVMEAEIQKEANFLHADGHAQSERYSLLSALDQLSSRAACPPAFYMACEPIQHHDLFHEHTSLHAFFILLIT